MTHQEDAVRNRIVAGRYQLLDELGRGGMGIVWRAEDRVIGRQVAIKELRLPEGIPPEERGVFEERVLREARTAGRLNDPAVVTVYDVVSDEGMTMIVMELIAAPTLSQVVQGQGPLPPHQVVSMGRQLLAALNTAHQAGVVHRDVKPSNIMLLPDGRVKLTDFGIAQAAEDPRLTTSGTLIGSMAYMAPERIRDSAATPGSDLWALGATLFFAVEGRAPFERPTTASTLHAIMTEVPFLTRCQGPLASAISGLLVGNPEGRLGPRQVGGLLDTAAGGTGPQGGPGPTPHLPAGQPGPSTHPFGQHSGPLAPARPGWSWKRTGISLLAAGMVFAAGLLTDRWLLTEREPTPPHPAMDAPMSYGRDGEIPVFDLTADEGSSCSTGELRAGQQYGEAVECDTPHDVEVFTSWNLFSSYEREPAFPAYPGEDTLVRMAVGACGLYFDSELVDLGERQDIRFRALVPTRESWEEKVRSVANEDLTPAGTSRVYCVLYSESGERLTEPARVRED
ncbi:serine/threonine-protein kinase [Actinoalloteichus caeruleus]|uniref:non-specific serine/threonine protein kinase n=1 Tax=Actinoalloteichus caeruleus DSM 43889 TaxID=1120930 RepID=A0ABT1JGB6_ACTCY|nr:serine/threonine-protein kinase [Actinoalloteichus caeruleus]MCP2331540.1 Serine/threonine protein kinase [Actinoalloteichus caeruleus DSM 43889]